MDNDTPCHRKEKDLRLRVRVYTFLIVSLLSVLLTLYQWRSNYLFIVPSHRKYKNTRQKTSSWQREYGVNLTSVRAVTLFGGHFELKQSAANESSVHCQKVNIKKEGIIKMKEDCFDERENVLRLAKRHLVNLARTKQYEIYKKKSGLPRVPFKVYRLAPKIFKEAPYQFLREYKNPCWFVKGNDLYCLPFFYVIGMPKCGSSDLFDKLTSHPSVTPPKWKEPGFWTKLHYIRKTHDLETYMEYFEDFRKMLQSGRGNLSSDITGEGTVASMWSLFDVQFLKDGVGYGLPDVIRAIQPQAKLFIILRDPIERLVSDYHYFGLIKRSSDDFHQKVEFAIQEFNNCLSQRQNVLACIGIERKWRKECIVRVSLGIYSVLLRQWFKVFPKDQIFVIQLTRWEKDCESVILRAYHFLELEPLSETQIHAICSRRKKLRTQQTKIIMKNETRDLLTCFYRPYQEELEKFMSDQSLDLRNL
ncbi:Carbohydrate sulfotransferase 15 [Holothuria leucospilota]|uniref:Carbohydrate sulfotransferase 15 n=1 Tax=Holothuria leucospilota TaxID=206669 RepID=A0A9Q1BS08_HOLLE|nr:Carbohydrate sulfotransferase 15 [Holothuria leucospilota]